MFIVFTPFQAKHHTTVCAVSPAFFETKKQLPFPIAAVWGKVFCMSVLYSVLSVFAGVVVSSGAGVGSVSVVSGCVAVGSVAEGSGVVVLLSVGVLLGFVGAVGVVGAVGSADGSVVTVLSGVWSLLGCEPVAVITLSIIVFELSFTAQLPHLGVRVIVVPLAAFMVKVNVLPTKICSV